MKRVTVRPPFKIGMRKIRQYTAMLLTIIYLVGVLGFDVHSSADTHRSYVISPLFGVSCEKIHPEALCHHHGHEECEEDEDCCHDTIEQLEITGDVQSDVAGVIIVGIQACPPYTTIPQICTADNAVFHTPTGFTPPAPDLAQLCILRI